MEQATEGLAYRGVAYDTGTNFATGQGELSRTVWTKRGMKQEIAAIADQLNCNSITLYGSDLDRLEQAATVAIDSDLHIWLQPRLVDQAQDEILDHLAETARLAESLRRDGAKISLTVGAVHLIFTPGIAPGEQYHLRMANAYPDLPHRLLQPTGRLDFKEAAPRLNAFLQQAATVARALFGGQLGYSAAPFEEVDWALFDAIGIMYQYADRPRTADEHIAEIGRYRKWGKPIHIAEFGTATDAEAESRAFRFYDIVDRSGPVPLVLDGYVRDESAQAAYHLKMFDIFERAGVAGVAVSEFIHPTHPHSDDPRLDIDTASMAIVKTIRDDFDNPDSTYRFEPKESFHAIADYYAHVGFQAAAR
ncbi:hypothetical protein F4553_003441 [Allocatelliglobosispora scoriae]|uniref:Abortive infection protein n=1 Tax=Allocatelliglobosispora scoriae TaxID=643052 RepID=A0A841BTI6_9ACTN|nr:abortive infection protein [Allocatelliglobosispora scoriae]MBB5870062.1 hypothetical protein [Allocatelliglobosispora scoriae]